MRRNWIAAGWLLIAVVLGVGLFAGGDLSIEAGLAFVIWTAPIGLIWQFHVYGVLLEFLPAKWLDPIGVFLVIVLAYAFWFYGVPRLFRRQTKQSK